MTGYVWIGDTTDIVLSAILVAIIVSFVVFVLVESK